MSRDQFGERRLARSGRTIENNRTDAIRFQQPPQEFSGPEKMLLADELVERPGTHACGQGAHRVTVFGLQSIK
jgi:hypothetical protein